MANNQFMSPTLAPDLLRRQFQLKNNQALAQQLMQSEQPQGQMISGHYVAPSWAQQLASALRPVVGQQIMNKMPDQMVDLQRAQQDYDRERFGAVFGQGGPMAAQDPQREFMIANLMGMDKYAAEKLRQSAPTSEQKNLGFLPEGSRNSLIAAPFLNEAGKDGVQMGMGPSGQVQAFEVPGYRDIQAANAGAVAGAQETAKAGLDLVEVPDGQGGTVMMPRSQAAQSLSGQTPQSQAPNSGLGATPPERVTEARSELPKVISQADAMLNSIDGILSHPGLSGAVGLQVPGMSMVPGTPEADFATRLDQLQGQAFLQAFESLKGGGQITEVEGKKAEQAIARMSRMQSEEAFKEAMQELRGVLLLAKDRAYSKAKVKPEGGANSSQEIPRITSPDQLQSLPSGSLFIAPDGTMRRVP